MSVVAVVLCKDEADIVGFTARYLLGQVDHLVVVDNGSTDGTAEILREVAEEALAGGGATVELLEDADPAYYQSRKMSAYAAYALERGHHWIVPVDADELWYATDGRTLREYLGGLAPDAAYARAELYNHLPTALDLAERCSDCAGLGFFPTGDGGAPLQTPCERCGMTGGEPNPFRRIGWRQIEHGALPKVAARLRPGLEIRQGNHSAYAPGSGRTASGLVVRHFSWRSAAQYERKLANGYRAYAATDLPEDVGAHWRMFGPPEAEGFSERVREHFERWFFVADPAADPTLIYDPAPLG